MEEVLGQIDAEDVPRILVLNKADAADPDELAGLSNRFPGAVAVSGALGTGASELVSKIAAALPQHRRMVELEIPYERADLVALLHRSSEVVKEEHRAEGTYMVANVDRSTAAELEPHLAPNPWSYAETDR